MNISMLRSSFSVPPFDKYGMNSIHHRGELPAVPRGIMSSFSSANICIAKPTCFRSFRQIEDCPFCLALAKTGSINPAKMAMIAITTSNSINVKPLTGEGEIFNEFLIGVLLVCALRPICASPNSWFKKAHRTPP